MIGFNPPSSSGSSVGGFNAAPAAPAAPPAPPTFEQQLTNFCAAATADRAPSHGVDHMTKVRVNAESIFDALAAAGEHTQMMNSQMRRMVSAAAQFHDIADHKYVADPASMGVEEELRKHFSDKASASLMKVIDAVSYSKEKKLRAASGKPEEPVSFVDTLGAAGSLLRDIVSDADKLEAIGSIGVQRCLQYTKESALKEKGTEPSQEEVSF